MTRRKKQRIRQGILVTLVVILGLGLLTYTGKILNDKYDWVEKTKDFFVTTSDGDEIPLSNSLPASSEVTPEAGVRVRGIEIQRAHGVDGKQTLTLSISPANADTGEITWTRDNAAVHITPLGNGRSAEIYVDHYFWPAATITVHEEYSDMTVTGKVYSYADSVLTGGTADSEFGNTDKVFAIKHSGSTVYKSVNELNLSVTYYNQGHISNFLTTNDSIITIKMGFIGSYSPFVKRMSVGTEYGRDYDPYGIHASGYGQFVAHITDFSIALNEGVNLFYIYLPNAHNEIGNYVAAFKITKAIEPQSITFPDSTFYG